MLCLIGPCVHLHVKLARNTYRAQSFTVYFLGLEVAADQGLLLPRPSLEALLEEYWDLMPEYQGTELESLEVLRILFGFFPTYRQACIRPQATLFWLQACCRQVVAILGHSLEGCCGAVQSPLKPQWDRVLQVGDASGIQSPLSFGGFGALTRHLTRLRTAITEALEADALDKGSLAQVNCPQYQCPLYLNCLG